MVELVFRRLVSRAGLVMAVLPCLLSGSNCRQAPPLAEAKDAASGEVRIDLDVIPMMDPVATSLSLRGDQAEAIRSSRTRLAVISLAAGSVPEANRLRIAAAFRSPRLREALRQRSFSGEGLRSGDQFHLRVMMPLQGESFGFIEEVPDEVKSLIEDLLRLAAALDDAPLSAAYLRSEPIEQQRARGMKATIPFHPLPEIPVELRMPATHAIEQPRVFLPLQSSQAERFLAVSEGRRQVYVTTGRDEHEITLYEGRSAPSGAQREQH